MAKEKTKCNFCTRCDTCQTDVDKDKAKGKSKKEVEAKCNTLNLFVFGFVLMCIFISNLAIWVSMSM